MHVFKPSQTPRTFANLKPLDLFIHDTVQDDQALGIVLPQENERVLRVLCLSGKDAFYIRDYESRHLQERIALPLGIESQQLMLRVDFSPRPISQHATPELGRLIFNEAGSAAIEAMFGPDRGTPTPCLVAIPDWTKENRRNPRFVFNRWALSYLDESKQWVDLCKMA